MPIYEYQCQKCRHHFEEIQKVSDLPVGHCPRCHGKVQRLISQTSFALKGKGWYKDGYAKPPPNCSPGQPPKTETGSDKKSADKTEAKSVEKRETASTAPKSAESKPTTPPPATIKGS